MPKNRPLSFSFPGKTVRCKPGWAAKASKYYFWDNGIRNAIINNFNELPLRNDVGALWENYLITERLKKQRYTKIFSNNYFWRTYDQQEIDLLEVTSKNINAFEFKYGVKKLPKKPVAFGKAYPDSGFEVINESNYLDFIL